LAAVASGANGTAAEIVERWSSDRYGWGTALGTTVSSANLQCGVAHPDRHLHDIELQGDLGRPRWRADRRLPVISGGSVAANMEIGSGWGSTPSVASTPSSDLGLQWLENMVELGMSDLEGLRSAGGFQNC
jgi:hypothetical protein